MFNILKTLGVLVLFLSAYCVAPSDSYADDAFSKTISVSFGFTTQQDLVARLGYPDKQKSIDGEATLVWVPKYHFPIHYTVYITDINGGEITRKGKQITAFFSAQNELYKIYVQD
ncbi:MAG: hypothetical protein LBS60_09010 [Deltaproteobacteria bacterium]|jgi:hypothetical protein|nr:hypothetical protein [Deltaproteobacteria bacterium]